MKFWICEDDAYVYKENLITPIPPSQANSVQDAFNIFLSSLRLRVEQAFEMLVARLKMLRERLQFATLQNAVVIFLCLKLYNFCLDRRDVLCADCCRRRISRKWK